MALLLARHGSSELADPAAAIAELRAAIDQPGIRAVVLFCSPTYDLDGLGAAIRASFDCPVIACTSAGQIGPTGYQRGGITGASLASEELAVQPYLVSPLSRCREGALRAAALIRARLAVLPGHLRAFGLLLVDGLSLAEETLTSVLYQSTGDLPIFGGSAGDDLAFQRTAVYWDGKFLSDAAVFALFETSHPFATFKLAHFTPTGKRLVITAADPAKRLVKEINGVPAAEGLAETLGIPVERLDAAVYSRSPLMLRLGSDHYVRSISQVNPDHSLTFHCAIDEGLVLTVGENVDPLTALEEGLRQAAQKVGAPALIVGCDCILRRLELEERHLDERAGELLRANKVIGFSTYGEQFNAVHVNQTLTGVVLGERCRP